MKDDSELYVRRSVANNLGDIAKDHPELAFERGARWVAGASEERKWLIRHAVRHPAKRGVKPALRLRRPRRPGRGKSARAPAFHGLIPWGHPRGAGSDRYFLRDPFGDALREGCGLWQIRSARTDEHYPRFIPSGRLVLFAAPKPAIAPLA